MEIRGAIYTENGDIDCELKIAGKWLPFTASDQDEEAYGRRVFATASALPPAPYVPPEPEPEPTEQEKLDAERAGMVASRFQAKAALMQTGRLDEVEQAVAAGDAMTKLAWAEAVQLRRTSPMIATLAAAVGFTDAEVDDLFRAAAEIEA